MGRAQDELLAALVGHSNHRGVDLEELDHRSHDCLQRRFQRERLRERARDLVERVQLPRLVALRRERALEPGAELRRPLVQLGVLDSDRKLDRES